MQDGKIKVAVVEDDSIAAEKSLGYFNRYSAEKGTLFDVQIFVSGDVFLEKYDGSFDLVFMDIDMPGKNGMETVKALRQRDSNVMIIFVTNLAQYAVNGYEYDAFDFIVKPVAYFNFSVKLTRALNRLENTRGRGIWVNISGGQRRILSSDVKYVEVMKHYIIYHTICGDIRTVGSMLKASEQFKGLPFALCNRCYLVNLAHVNGVRQYQVDVGGDVLLISHLKRNEFLSKLNSWLAGRKEPGNV